ncbi:DUF2721 domain-containing protein [Novosphingobium album (ex Liu et al. 2023)]|uniref:DUF2721 domain-containing protein n=1 Tax=Novosphingobium album (ex Liu et al. 2023) TaxID=3031130 RepID=A0ABT5WT86_9SPHN|nr:DUF2721 domain-containing protein [Novosphingobium album (ex Liu et al. 2023)]MDE8652707.1 DUF2721 domain-containing protein [Novosphingobium album (ex Liu et al. 2023)]
MIAQTIQLALAPVFVLVAIGNILNILSTRLGRIVDRARTLQDRHVETSGPDHDMIVVEIRVIDRRIALITGAIRLMVIAALMIGTTVAVLFFEEISKFNLQMAATATFLVALTLLMGGLVQFLRETQIAAAALRIPRDYLELDRDL